MLDLKNTERSVIFYDFLITFFLITAQDMENMSDDDGWEFVNLGDQQSFGIKTAGLEEKATACQMLVSNRVVLVTCVFLNNQVLKPKSVNKYSLWYWIKEFFYFGDSEFGFQALIYPVYLMKDILRV